MIGSTPSTRGPAEGTLAEPQVRAMFDRIAGFYDAMNSVMTAGLHHRWRRRAADLAAAGPGDRVLDVATGTGDLALELALRVAPDGDVVAVDFSAEMLARGRAKAQRLPVPGPRFEHANALSLPYPDDSFDAATVGFGARNFADLERGVHQLVRVVRPGGRVVILEITTPRRPPLSWFYRFWFDRAVPLIGRLAGLVSRVTHRAQEPQGTSVADAYRYLPSSVRRFPPPEELAEIMTAGGLRGVRYVLTAGGIIAIHVGEVA